MAVPTIVLVVTLLAFILALGYKKRPKNFPPGPTRLPYVGNVPQLGLDMYKGFIKLGEKHGDIIGASLGMNWFVALNHPDDIRELMGRLEFAGRSGFNGFVDTLVENHNYGLTTSNGRTWQEHRRFSLRTLREFGFGKRSIEAIIMEEVREIISQLKKQSGQPLSTKLLFNPPVLNVIWSLVAGERFSYDDPKIQHLQTLMSRFMENALSPARILLTFFPDLLKIRERFPFLIPLKDGEVLRENFHDYFRQAIRQHEATLSAGNPRDFIDAYVEERDKTTDPASSFYCEAVDAEKHLLMTLMDLFLAGSETTSTTLRWAVSLLAHHPESQKKMAAEIHCVVGNREVLLQDKLSLLYVEATIMEVERFSSLLPLGVPHSPTQDVVYKGHFIPKGTMILTNIYACHHNPSIWGDPENFRPERFLSADEKSVIRSNKAWMPFGVGKRQCMGESLARDELSLFFANLVRNFVVAFPPDEPKPKLEGVFYMGVVSPESHNLILSLRK